jgi:Ni/Fe-hydrogenase subunit HybB-like protein
MQHAKPIGGKVFTRAFLAFVVIAVIGYFFILKRFIYGLGSVTNLSDGYPWGIWIAYDVIIGCALACGGYAMALVVYIFNNFKYHGLVRPAVLTSVFGYTLAGVSILFDIGRYWQFYNLLLPKYIQFNSIMVEVALCIMAYTLVLWIELSPAFFERFKERFKFLGGINNALEKALFFIVALGIVLPTMHQSSLGSLLLIAGSKMSPLWHTPLLPLLFLISCIVMGYSIVVGESVLSSIGFKREMETAQLSKISIVAAYLTMAYVIIRFGDLAFRGAIAESFNGNLQGVMFWIENVLYIVPMIMLLVPRYRNAPRTLFASAVMLLLAAGLYRINTYLVGFDPGHGWTYFPSASELMITLAIVATEILAYLIIVKKLPVLPEAEPQAELKK